MKIRKQNVKFFLKFLAASLLFLVGFLGSNAALFYDFPIFGIKFLGQFLLGIVGALIGYYLVPRYYVTIRAWAEDLIVKTTYTLVSDFWAQYNKRLEESRKQRIREREKKDKTKTKETFKNGVVIDTSVLIDGRVPEIAKTGFFPAPMIIPRYVINELHLLADSADEQKRAKGRRGLDAINDLKKAGKVYLHGKKGAEQGVDQEMVALAQEHKLKLATLDFNLNKVAKVAGVKVLNINELVDAIKPVYIPGDKIKLKVVQKGKTKQQGVGYLADGTMVVIENGGNFLNKDVEVTVSKLIQTNAGKMVFAQV